MSVSRCHDESIHRYWRPRALAWREIVRFFRQRNRIVGSIGTPLVFWLLFGAGLSEFVSRRGGRQISRIF